MSGNAMLYVLGLAALMTLCCGYGWDVELSRISTLRKLGYSKWRRQQGTPSPTSPPTSPLPSTSAPTGLPPTTPPLPVAPPIGPPSMPRLPYEIDNLFLKYSLGLAPPEGEDFDPAALAAAYFNIYTLIGDEYIARAQFVKTLLLKMIQTRNNCMVSRMAKFMQMAIGSVIQEGWKAVVNWLPPILVQLLPDLRAKGIDVRDEVPQMLGKMLIRKSLVPFSRRLMPLRFIMNFTETVKTELESAADPKTFGDRIATLLDDELQAEEPECPQIEKVAKVFQEELPKLSDSIGSELIEIVAGLRTKLELRGVAVPDVSAIEGLFKTIEPFVQDGLRYVCGDFATGKPQDIVNAINLFGVDLPDDLTKSLKNCDSKSVFIMDQIEDFFIGYDGPFRQLIDELEGVHLGIP